MSKPTEKLVQFISEVKYRDLPPSGIQKTKDVLLDAIGCALGAYAMDRTGLQMEFINEVGEKPVASIIGAGRTSPPLAAFANAELISGLDYDCIGPIAGHVIPYAIPPCLAAAEMAHASGKDLLLALTLAFEVGARVAGSVVQLRVSKDTPPYYQTAPRYSYGTAVFGGVAGAAKLLGMARERITHALGIAGVSVPVPGMIKWQYNDGPSPMLKNNNWAGWVAQLAMVAVIFGRKGFTSDPAVLDGKDGFWNMYGSPFFKEEVITRGLGEVWHIGEARFKYYPACLLHHGGIEGVSNLVQEHRINPEKITRITVTGDPWLLTPSRAQTEVLSSMDAYVSVAYNFALAAYFGTDPGPYWATPRVYGDPRIKALMKRVRVLAHPNADELALRQLKSGAMPVFNDTIVEIIVDGRKYTTTISTIKGTGNRPLSTEVLEAKFRGNAAYSKLSPAKVNRLIELVRNLEEVKDTVDFTSALTVGRGSRRSQSRVR